VKRKFSCEPELGCCRPTVPEIVSELAVRYRLASIVPLLDICRAAGDRSDLSIAVLGRFKAGKSSFLNHLIGEAVLPVGVTPVTSVVTEVAHGADDVAVVRFTDGREAKIAVADLQLYVTETQNPLNRKQVEAVSVCLTALARWPSLRFIDTPGLESALAHNTEASLGWAPKVDIALIAIGVDPPLSEHGVSLIEMLFRYTPRVAVLLTKADLLPDEQLDEVICYIQRQLAKRFTRTIPIYPYSIRPGFEKWKRDLEDKVLKKSAMDLVSERRAISDRKAATLLSECEQYLSLALKSAELHDTERFKLDQLLLAEREALAGMRLEVRLLARHAASATRPAIEKPLALHESPIRQKLLAMFEEQSTQLPRAFAKLVDAFNDWLDSGMSSEMLDVSGARRSEFVQPLVDLQREYQRVLQNFRDRLSARTLAIYGVTLNTTEPEILPPPPKTPDVRIGRAFDHSWEILSPLLPMALLRTAVLNRFRRKIADETFKNLSRLTSQWEEIVTGAIYQLQREAERRMEELLTTVQGLLSASSDRAPQIRADLGRLHELTSESHDANRVAHHL
jgi:GTP-binding protein EngB required for normal cell division